MANKVIGTASDILNAVKTWVNGLMANKVDKVSGKGLSANDFTNTLKTKLDGIADNAQVNVIETVKVNNTALTPSSKAVNIDLSSYAKKTDLASVYKYKGSCTWAVLIAKTDAEVGDVWNVTDKQGHNYACVTAKTTGASAWDDIGGDVDLSAYATTSAMNTALAGKSDTGHTHDDRYYTESEITTKLAGKANSSHSHGNITSTGVLDVGYRVVVTDGSRKITTGTDAQTEAINSGITANWISNADTILADAEEHWNDQSNPHAVTKSQVGLGSVVNTGDSATPVSGGTTKFTTGGAYTELAKKADKITTSTDGNTTFTREFLDGNLNIAISEDTANSSNYITLTTNYIVVGKSNKSTHATSYMSMGDDSIGFYDKTTFKWIIDNQGVFNGHLSTVDNIDDLQFMTRAEMDTLLNS